MPSLHTRSRPYPWVERVWIFLPWGVIASAAVLGLLAPGASWALAPWPFLVSAVLIGMPHGALDWSLWLSPAMRRRGLVATAASYLLILSASLALLLVAPGLTLGAFAIVTIVHFGLADARHAADVNGVAGPTGLSLWLIAIARGAIVLALPFVWSPRDAIEPATLALRLVDAPPVNVAPSVSRSVAMVWLAAAMAMLIGGVLLSRPARTQTKPATADHPATEPLLLCHLVELALLAAAAAVLSPMFYVGLYFLSWHALRHFRVVRDVAAPATPARLRDLIELHRQSLPLLVPTLLVYLALGYALIGWHAPMRWATLLLLFFAVLTPAHHWLVERALRRSA